MKEVNLAEIFSNSKFIFGTPPEDVVEEVIPTGSPSLDLATDIGGIPVGRLSIIFGPPGSGKTTISMHIASNAIELGKRVLFVDVESTFDSRYMKVISSREGIEITKNNFILAIPETSNKSLEIVETAIDNDLADFIILDSVGALASDEELGKDTNIRTIAPIARMLSPFLRKNMPKVRNKNITLLFINQVRSAVGNMFAEYIMPGGNVLAHQSSLTVKFTKHKKIKDKDKNDIGLWIKATVDKNKIGRPGRTVYIPIIFGEGVDKYEDLVNFATALGIIRRAAAYYYLVEREDDIRLGKGMEEVKRLFKEKPEIFDLVFNRCKEVFITKGGAR